MPLTLTELVEHVLRASPPTEAERADAIMLPGAPFPLLQQTEHPVTGDMVWSVHPCEVRAAVAEVVQSEMDDESQSPDTTALPVRWLEAWFMLSDSVVNLSL